MNKTKKRKTVGLTISVLAVTASASVGYAAWQIINVNNTQGAVSDGLYSVVFHDGEISQEVINGLEYQSKIELSVLPVTEEKLTSGIYSFLGWTVGSDQTVFSGLVEVSELLEKDAKSDNVIDIYAKWSSDIPLDKVLLTVAYSGSVSGTHKQLADNDQKFYLFNVVINEEGHHPVSFSINGSSKTPNDWIDISNIPTRKLSFSAVMETNLNQ